MVTMFFRNSMASVLLVTAMTGMAILMFLAVFGDHFYSGFGLMMSKWFAGTVAQYALVFGLASFLEGKSTEMTGSHALLLIVITLAGPGTLVQLLIIARFFADLV